MEQPPKIPHLTAAHRNEQRALNDGPQENASVRVLSCVAVHLMCAWSFLISSMTVSRRLSVRYVAWHFWAALDVVAIAMSIDF